MASRPTRKRFDVGQISPHGCPTGKVAHLTKSEAFDVAEWRMQRDEVEPGCHLMPVECGQCGMWHVANRRIVSADRVAEYQSGQA